MGVELTAAADVLGGAAVQRVGLSAPFTNEIGACFDLNRQVADTVAAARGRGALPVVLTGNCHTQQAVVAGLGARDLARWSGSTATPTSTRPRRRTGFFDGTALSMTVGYCWTGLCATVTGFEPLPADRAVLAGVRDVERAERGGDSTPRP